MALKMGKQFSNGIELTEAYFKVVSISFSFTSKIAYISVATYKDESSRTNNKLPIEVVEHAIYQDQYDIYFKTSELDTANVNMVRQAYKFLKTNPEFANALDII